MGRFKLLGARVVNLISIIVVITLLFCGLPAIPVLAESITIQASAGPNGNIFPNDFVLVESGEDQTFTFAPDSHYYISSLIVDSQAVDIPEDNTYTILDVQEPHSIEVYYSLETYTIDVTCGENGMISPSEDQQTVEFGGEQIFSITPDVFYHLDSLLVDGQPAALTDDTYTFSNISANHSIEVTFALNTYTITVFAGSGGSIDPSGIVQVEENGWQTFDIYPDEGYEIDYVVVDGESVGSVPYVDFNDIAGDHSIEAYFVASQAPAIYTITALAGDNGNITPNGNISVNEGDCLDFVITPDDNFQITDVLIDGESLGSTAGYTFFDVTNDHTISATFAINLYCITAIAGENGSISPFGEVSVNAGDNQTFVITADENYYVDSVLVDGESVGLTEEAYSFIAVMDNHSFDVTFALNTYKLTYTAGAHGSVGGTLIQTVDYGANGRAVTAIPTTGYHFVNWSDNSTANPRSDLNVSANKAVTANFAINVYTLTYTSGANGSIGGTLTQTVNHGGDGSAVTAIPTTGYHFVNWSDNSTANPRTDLNVSANKAVTANFAINVYTLTYTSGANGSIGGTLTQTVNHGGDGSAVTALPATGYHFVNWSDNSTANPRSDLNVTRNLSVTANFATDTFQVNFVLGEKSTRTGGGTLVQTVNYGTDAIEPILLMAAGWTFAGWDKIFTNVSCDLVINSKYRQIAHIITASAGTSGSIDPSGEISVKAGDSRTFSVRAAENYHVASVLLDNEVVTLTNGAVTFNNVQENHTISVTFAIDTFTITAAAGSNGSINPVGAVVVDHGVNQLFSITPNSGYTVASVEVNGISVNLDRGAYTFNHVATNHRIAVTFKILNNGGTGGSPGSNSAPTPTPKPTLTPTPTPKPTPAPTPTLTPTPKPTPMPSSAPNVTPHPTENPATNAGQGQSRIEINLNGNSKTLIIDKSGETVGETLITSRDQRMSLRIPENTHVLSGGSILPTTIIDTNVPNQPANSNIIGIAYECLPNGIAFDPAITLVWHYTPDSLPPGTDETKLQIAFLNEISHQWEAITCSVDTVNKTLSAAIKHFSQYAIIAPAAKPSPVITPILAKSPAASQVPASMLSTPKAEKKPAIPPYNPVLLLVEFIVLALIAITVILLRKNKKFRR